MYFENKMDVICLSKGFLFYAMSEEQGFTAMT